MDMYNPAHPGAVLRDALEGMEMTVAQFADYIGVARNTVSRILNEKAGVTPEMSIRLAQAFGQQQTDIWFLLQGQYDFWQASQKKQKKIAPLPRKAA